MVQIENDNYNDCTIFFCIYKTARRCIRCRAIRARSDGAAEWSAIGRESKKEENTKEKKKDWVSGSDFVVLFTSAGRDAVARVQRATLISGRANGGQVSSIHT